MAGLKPEFEKRNCKILGLSVDPVDDHVAWSKDIQQTQGHAVTYPMIGDPELKVAKLYDMLPEDAGDSSQGRTPADNATVRSVFVIGPDKKIKATLTYPMSTGRNFDEVGLQRVPVTFEFASPGNYVAYRRELSTRFVAATAGQSKTDQQAAWQAVARAAEAYRGPAGMIRMENWAYCISATRP